MTFETGVVSVGKEEEEMLQDKLEVDVKRAWVCCIISRKGNGRCVILANPGQKLPCDSGTSLLQGD
jgi:ABC-type transporter Mla maintaining outer membrane lipid asymmetry ATPase subunit MlaF